MPLGTGSLTDNLWLDDFMAAEGYERRKRSYSKVVECWCGSSSLSQATGQAEGFKHYQLCHNCGSLILKYVLPEDNLSELYGARYFRDHQLAIGLPAFIDRYESDAEDRIPVWIETIKEFNQTGRVIEVGCGHGRFVKELSNLGYDSVGIDLDPDICSWAREKTSCDIRSVSVDNLRDEQFDVSFASDVMEHLYDPVGFLISIMNVLKPGGRAIFQTVVFDRWEACPPNMMRPLFHTVLYSRSSLGFMESANVSLLKIKPGVFGSHLVVFEKKADESGCFQFTKS